MIQHKIAVIDALPGFVESGSDPEKRNVILNKLIEMVVQVDETGILGKERQFKTSNDEIIKLADLLMKLKNSLQVLDYGLTIYFIGRVIYYLISYGIKLE
ncbi:MAG: hypothetical protein IPP51_01775 [Bacteroidetes bacterium]|nr:hypothetical protein [Bacteroidota bacterium]